MSESTPRLIILAGPNGAGKSTLYHQVLRPKLDRLGWEPTPFLNADDWARERWGPEVGPERAYEAAQAVARQRDDLLQQGRSFTTETVFSHESKLDVITDAQQRGYKVYLEAVLVDVDTAVERVAQRVAQGGHDVPEDKIRARYERTDRHLAVAVTRADTAEVWINTHTDPRWAPGERFGHERVAVFKAGELARSRRLPAWMPPSLTSAVDEAPKRGTRPPAGRPGHGRELPPWSAPQHRPKL